MGRSFNQWIHSNEEQLMMTLEINRKIAKKHQKNRLETDEPRPKPTALYRG
jgi:hypothetical protein